MPPPLNTRTAFAKVLAEARQTKVYKELGPIGLLHAIGDKHLLDNGLKIHLSLQNEWAWFAVNTIMGAGGFLGRYETIIAFHKATFIMMAMYDAASLYDATAVTIIPVNAVRAPKAERTVKNANLAMMYAGLEAVRVVLPDAYADVSYALALYGVDAEKASTDASTPSGAGLAAAKASIQAYLSDPMNPTGVFCDTVYPTPYANCMSAYQPVNTPYTLNTITRWQPLLETSPQPPPGRGYMVGQTWASPQTEFGLSPLNLKAITGPLPVLDEPWPAPLNMTRYTALTDEIIQASATLTDKKKMLAEYFDAKFTSLGPMGVVLMSGAGQSQITNVASELYTNCIYEAFQAAWQQKGYFDGVRPVSAVHHLYGGDHITAYAGPRQGTKSIPGKDFLGYLRTMPHQDYPSGTGCSCVVFVEHYKIMTGSPVYVPDWVKDLVFSKGCSFREPDFTPQEDVTVQLTTWDDLLTMCAQSRLDAGVHFQPAIDASVKLCRSFGTACAAKVKGLLAGTA